MPPGRPCRKVFQTADVLHGEPAMASWLPAGNEASCRTVVTNLFCWIRNELPDQSDKFQRYLEIAEGANGETSLGSVVCIKIQLSLVACGLLLVRCGLRRFADLPGFLRLLEGRAWAVKPSSARATVGL